MLPLLPCTEGTASKGDGAGRDRMPALRTRRPEKNGGREAMAQSYWLFGSRLTVLADAEVTGGRYDLIEGQFPPHTETPLHRHNHYMEQLYVLDGELTVWAGARTTVLHAGDSVTIPAGTPHAVAATGDGPARGLAVASPSGFARLIKE